MTKELNNNNNIKKYFDKDNKFIEFFNNKTGFYMRTGILDKDGKDTGVDPFMRNFPQLLDVGVMATCQNALNGTCKVQCYQGGAGIQKPNMSVENFKKIAEECKGKSFQFALGGRGDVNKHENFKELLEVCKENDIVPNYTTSGLNLTDEEVQLTKEHCGATAVSWYDSASDGYTIKAINKFIEAGVKTNIHYVLGNDSIDMALDHLKNDKFPKGINAIIFLLHKNVGLGRLENVLKIEDPKVQEFYKLIDTTRFNYKIGFDTCNMPFIVNLTNQINPISTEPCESGKFSAYIDAEMQMIPCSFDNQEKKWCVDLNTHTIKEAWESEQFEDFRNHSRNSCSTCKDWKNCMGGCPIRRSIVGCARPEKDLK
jgi:radical SAM protein with 4Fe4S-binding SPASM domain